MALMIALILAAMIALAALELYVFWTLGERDDRRHRARCERRQRQSGRDTALAAGAGEPKRTGAWLAWACQPAEHDAVALAT
jgi:hypothetical protein